MSQRQINSAGEFRQARILGAMLVLLALLGGAGWLIFRSNPPDTNRLLREAERALADGAPQDAERLARRVLSHDRQSARALLVAAAARVRLEDYASAFALYERVPVDGSEESLEATFRAGLILMQHLHRAVEAEARFRRVLQWDPHRQSANAALAELLGREARRREATPMILELLRQRNAPVDFLILLGTGAIHKTQWLSRCRDAAPEDAPILLGLAYHARNARRADEAIRLLNAARQSDPHLIEAQALLGELLLEHRSPADVIDWHSQLPRQADEHPVIWQVRAEGAERAGRTEVAIRCYWEALRRDPNLRRANYRLSQLLIEQEETEYAEPFLRRARQLQDLKAMQDHLLASRHTSLAPIRRVVRQLERLGRIWEAWGWSLVAHKLNPRAEWIAATRARLMPVLEGNPPLTLSSANPAIQVDLQEFPLPDQDVFQYRERLPDESPRPSTVISFQERAHQTGLDFQYVNGGNPTRESSHSPIVYEQNMYEFSGGGVAVLDYDGDGWPDIHLTQGCDWPQDPQQDAHLDRLYRNRRGKHFQDVTSAAGLAENGFSQGVAAGDYNNDGFPDLYVANIGPNRLYRNNGDGTFTDVTNNAGIAGDQWTTSCLMADLNGDGLPEIYAVHYLSGHDLFERICQHNDGNPRMCMPFQFPAAQDQLYGNLGNGRFENITQSSGIAVPDGKGLGIVAADFTGSGKLDLFIANDTVPNFYFVNRTADPHTAPVLVEQGLVSGLAFNRDGRAEGCMGIAVDDINGDGRLDLFVTNFHKETNTLYVQQADSLFEDQTRESGLAEPSLPVLGFGTQFLDADLDGHPDLILTNGHIDDLRAYGRPYRMRPQFFHNIGEGRFIELPAETLGDFFDEASLGRSLARIDWNRDGREDVVISHLDRPAALLTNTTRNAAHFVAIELRGVRSARDAIGATVRLRAGQRVIVRQLTAGDGYQSSNQRQLIFGLGDDQLIDELTVRWPSGWEQTFEKLPADTNYLLIEGQQQPIKRSH